MKNLTLAKLFCNIKKFLNSMFFRNTILFEKIEFQDPVFLCLILYLILSRDYSGFFRLSLISSALHECGHIVFYIIFCKSLPVIRVTATGFCMKTKKLSLPAEKMFALAFAGPFVNFVVAIICFFKLNTSFNLAVCAFMTANILIGTFNLLPIPPLDGWMMLYYLKEKLIFNKK